MESLIKHTENCTVPADKIAVLTKEAQKMITNIKKLEKYCTDYKNIENYAEAVKSPLKYDLHHRREISESKSASDLIAENLYYYRPPEELIFLEHRDHIRLHNKGKPSPWLGKHPSAETRKKISDARKGRHWHLENGKRVYTD